ncbi:MAG: aminodeoxychorismate/anthranilate synthase component II [Propionibacteriaceae bacterium]|nr:aminodeoxychorismate/anthranilate synthase component II [Propionibacteriaceae bacterium]
MSRSKILVIDNYDSFVYNLVQYLAQLGADVEVWRNDDERFANPAFADGFDGILLSPGPGTPEEAGVCVDVVRSQAGKTPIFGVCLGLQSIGVAYGSVVDRAPELLHGKTSLIQHQGVGVLAGLPSPFTATRYHSLAIEADTLADELEVTATTASGVIMAVRHRLLQVEAVQFHPESVLTEGGYQMLANWLAVCGDDEAPQRAVGLAPLMSALSNSPRPELDTDSRSDGSSGLRDRVLPGSLTGATHHDQVPMTQVVLDGGAAASGTQQQRPR